MSKFQDRMNGLREQEKKWMFWSNLSKAHVWLPVGSVIAIGASSLIYNGLYLTGIVGEQSINLVTGLTTITSLGGVLFAGLASNDKLNSVRWHMASEERMESRRLKKKNLAVSQIKERFFALTREKQLEVINCLKKSVIPVYFDKDFFDVANLLKTISYNPELTADEIVELREELEVMVKPYEINDKTEEVSIDDYSRIKTLEEALVFIDMLSEQYPGQIVSGVLHEVRENRSALEYYIPQIDWIEVNVDDVYNALFKEPENSVVKTRKKEKE